MKTEPNAIDQSLVHGEYVFRTHLDRNRYIGTLTRDRPKWLKDHPDTWKLVRNVQQEASSYPDLGERASHVPAKAVGPNSRTSAQEVQNDSKQGGADSAAVASEDGPSPRQSARPSVPPIADKASSAPRDQDEIVIGGRRYVSSKRLASLLRISLTTLSRRCAAGKAPPKIKISGDYFELPEG